MASISVNFEPGNYWTPVTTRTRDDLPAHVLRTEEGRGAYWSTEPRNQPPSYKCLHKGRTKAVEFINDAWYLLTYSPAEGSYQTRTSNKAPRDNDGYLGWWNENDPQNPERTLPTEPEQVPLPASSSSSGRYGLDPDADSESDTESHHTAQSSNSTQHSRESSQSPTPHLTLIVPQQASSQASPTIPIFVEPSPVNPRDAKTPQTTNPTSQPQITAPQNPLPPAKPTIPMTSINTSTGTSGTSGGTPQIGGGLKGIPPSPFTGNRSESAQFKRELLRFIKLNSDHDLIKEYYARILFCLGLFKGPLVQLWVNEIEDVMERELASTTAGITKNSISLWNDFLAAFDRDWTDTLNKEKAYSSLITLKMQPGQLDDYILNFERLAGIAGWSRDAPGTVEFFKRGLVPGLYRACLMGKSIPQTMDQWQTACREETQRYKLLKSGPGVQRYGPTQSVNSPRSKARDPNAMDVDAAVTNPLPRLTNEEREHLRKEGRCYRCRRQGHISRECPTPPRTQAKARTTETEPVAGPSEEAPPYSPPKTTSVAASASEDKVRQAHRLIQSMDDEEKRRYYALDQDFCDADL